MPEQIIEIPEVDSKMCAVKAWRKWMMMRKGRRDETIPVFTYKDGSLVTVGDFNRKLALLLPEEYPKITARAFRPALATIMARQGASQDTLKSLGRWQAKPSKLTLGREELIIGRRPGLNYRKQLSIINRRII